MKIIITIIVAILIIIFSSIGIILGLNKQIFWEEISKKYLNDKNDI